MSKGYMNVSIIVTEDSNGEPNIGWIRQPNTIEMDSDKLTDIWFHSEETAEDYE